jgi:hypothetical protein
MRPPGTPSADSVQNVFHGRGVVDEHPTGAQPKELSELDAERATVPAAGMGKGGGGRMTWGMGEHTKRLQCQTSASVDCGIVGAGWLIQGTALLQPVITPSP